MDFLKELAGLTVKLGIQCCLSVELAVSWTDVEISFVLLIYSCANLSSLIYTLNKQWSDTLHDKLRVLNTRDVPKRLSLHWNWFSFKFFTINSKRLWD